MDMFQVTINDNNEVKKRIAEIEKRVAECTPATWVMEVTDEGDLVLVLPPPPEGKFGSSIYMGDMEQVDRFDLADAEFIANARQDIPWLLQRIEELENAAYEAVGVISHSEERKGYVLVPYAGVKKLRETVDGQKPHLVDVYVDSAERTLELRVKEGGDDDI